jgi:predicted transcriptional regulator
MTEPVRFSDSITIRVQPEITALVDRAARAKGSKPSEWARQALLEGLRAAGLDPAAIPASDAGSLYDSQEGKQRYAWVDGDEIRAVSYHDAKPEGWLPVKHFDSEPQLMAEIEYRAKCAEGKVRHPFFKGFQEDI